MKNNGRFVGRSGWEVVVIIGSHFLARHVAKMRHFSVRLSLRVGGGLNSQMLFISPPGVLRGSLTRVLRMGIVKAEANRT